jgi:hypothetical protein
MFIVSVVALSVFLFVAWAAICVATGYRVECDPAKNACGGVYDATYSILPELIVTLAVLGAAAIVGAKIQRDASRRRREIRRARASHD